MFKKFQAYIEYEMFCPSLLLGTWLNPFFVIRRGLYVGIKEFAQIMQQGKLLDFGCGKKPYEHLFSVSEYIGIDIDASGHDHKLSKIDHIYDGKTLPFADQEFDYVFASEVFEHVFNLDDVLAEIHRVLRPGGYLAFTCPFVWDEHEQPYDFARYSSFAIDHLMKINEFEVIMVKKSSGYVSTVAQMMSSYIYQYLLPKNIYLKTFLVPIFVAPVNIAGIILEKVLPRCDTYYLNNIVLVQRK